MSDLRALGNERNHAHLPTTQRAQQREHLKDARYRHNPRRAYACAGLRRLGTTQQELAYLVGLSRQRVNEALTALAAQSSIRVEYGGLRVLDLATLRSHVFLNRNGL